MRNRNRVARRALAVQSTNRVAIGYCRCSTEEQSRSSSELNTLQAQEQMIRNYCLTFHPEWQLEIVHEVRSAKDTNRPLLQQILQRVKAGEVQAVIVYKIDRLSRSLKDLLNIEALLQDHDTALVSIEERFDTSDPIGRCVRNILATFAELEREMIAKRIRDKMREMARCGLWVRGKVPFGYRLDQRRLQVVPERAQWVRYLFERFRETGSVGKVVEEMNASAEFRRVWREAGYRHELRTDCAVDHLLTNPTYTGALWVREECLCENAHEPIIPADLFQYVQSLLERNRPYKPKPDGEVSLDAYPLRGVVSCHECGGTLTPAWVQGNSGVVRYYDHSRYRHCKGRRRVNAERLHKAVWRAVQAVLCADESILQALRRSAESEHEAVRREYRSVQQEIDRLLALHASGVEIPDIADRLRFLHARRQELSSVCVVNYEEVEQRWRQFQQVFQEWERAWEQMSHEQRREALTLAVERVEVVNEYVRVYIPLPNRGRFESGNGLVEGEGFEPPSHTRWDAVFKTAAFSHSATPPLRAFLIIPVLAEANP